MIAKKAGQAIHILDRFPIMMHLSRAIDKVRTGEAKGLKEKGYHPVMKKSRWLLLKRPRNLSEKQTNSSPSKYRKTRGRTAGGPVGRFFRALMKWFALSVAGAFTLLLALMLVFRFVDPPTWSWKLQREFDPPASYPKATRHQWRDIDDIPPAVQLAVVAAEDQNFPYHHGVDLDAIQSALGEVEEGKTLRGASTITQQTVKNLFLWSRKDWSRKVLEGGLALLLELLWGKERVLEVYLNIVEFAPGIYGVDAASEYWYRRPLDQLTVNQAARLAAVLPNPWRYRAEPPSPYVAGRAVWIEGQMDKLGYGWLSSVNGW